MEHQLEAFVRLSPADWPPGGGEAGPGDLTRFAVQGLAMAPPPVLMPWDRPENLLSRGSYYAGQAPHPDPVRNAPLNTAAGGVVYFGSRPEAANLSALLRVIGVQAFRRDYAAYLFESEDPKRDRCLRQLRLVTEFALKHHFSAPLGEAALPEQPHTIGEVVEAFLEHEIAAWDEATLHGCLGGDGDWAYETLAFGLMVENDYYGIYRVWSRPRLVTK